MAFNLMVINLNNISSKILNKLIESQKVNNCKKGLGYENYNAVPPPYIGNFMPPTHDLSFTGLDKFVNKPVVENCKAMSSEEEPKEVKKNDDALIIEEWVSDDEEEDVSQPKIEKKIVRHSIVKKEFVKSKQQEKTARKIVKQVEHHRQNTHSPRGNQRNWNTRSPQQNGVAERRNRMLIEAAKTMLADSKLPTTFWAEAINTACYVQNRVLVVKPHNKTPYELFHGLVSSLVFCSWDFLGLLLMFLIRPWTPLMLGDDMERLWHELENLETSMEVLEGF
ncbi:retrovirus-related pol polyprotein from transposon TNT 1-94 [Tanacetum coccineum]